MAGSGADVPAHRAGPESADHGAPAGKADIAPFFVADVITIGVLIAFLEIILWLPKTLMG